MSDASAVKAVVGFSGVYGMLAPALCCLSHRAAHLMTPAKIDFDRLLKLRLVVARVGEMDLAKWWNTRGQLGRLGTTAVRRGFPRTHYFAQARSVFSVAGFRCREVFDPPKSVTLWQLPESVEEEFETHWERWLDQADQWKPFFLELETLKETELKAVLHSFNLITDEDSEAFSRLRRSAEGRAVPLPAPFTATNQEIVSLALGFARGEPGALAVPYARLANA
jgi:hypothetical protein